MQAANHCNKHMVHKVNNSNKLLTDQQLLLTKEAVVDQAISRPQTKLLMVPVKFQQEPHNMVVHKEVQDNKKVLQLKN